MHWNEIVIQVDRRIETWAVLQVDHLALISSNKKDICFDNASKISYKKSFENNV